ncbi:MAG: tetratricopeptide repeat protein [Bryobacteraceae bacterium]|nr:tetratricopeptide repeat protein [Bryobacteraceae bacterium]
MTLALALLLLGPPQAQAAYEKGTALFAEGRAADAIPWFAEAARLEPDNAQYWKALGVAHAKIEDYAGSIEPLRRACDLKPDLADACYYLGRAYYAADLYEKAIEPLKRALRYDPAKGRVEAALGQCYEALIRFEEAEKWFRSAITRRDAGRQMAHLAYARFLTRQGRAAEAVPVAAAAQEPETPEARFELALALSQCDRLEEALRAAQRALELRPDYEEAYVLRSKIEARLKAPPPR